MIRDPETNKIKLTRAEFDCVQRANARNGFVIYEADLKTFDEYREAVFMALSDEVAPDVLEFLEKSSSPGDRHGLLEAIQRVPGNPWMIAGRKPGTHLKGLDVGWRTLRSGERRRSPIPTLDTTAMRRRVLSESRLKRLGDRDVPVEQIHRQDRRTCRVGNLVLSERTVCLALSIAREQVTDSFAGDHPPGTECLRLEWASAWLEAFRANLDNGTGSGQGRRRPSCETVLRCTVLLLLKLTGYRGLAFELALIKPQRRFAILAILQYRSQ